MKKIWPFIIVILVLAGIYAGLCMYYFSMDDTSGENTEDVSAAPDFTVYDSQGNPVDLSDFQGKPVVLNFWATWCGPCKNEMPEFEEAYHTYGDQVQFLMVNLTDGSYDTVESVTEFIVEAGYTFPVFFDTQSDAAMTYNVQSIPTSYFIDEAGNIVAQATGMLSAEKLQEGINLILGG